MAKISAAMSKIGRLVAKWKKLYLRAKPLELQLEEARHAVRDAIVASGEDHVVTKLGTFALRTKDVVDWEGMARAIIKPEFVAQLIPAYTKKSAPWVVAPSDWGAEARS